MIPNSRDTDSRSSPRSRRSTVARLRRAENRPLRSRSAAAPVALRALSAAVDSSTCFLISTLLLRELSRNQVSKKTLGRRTSVLARFLNNTICVSHTHFDRVSIGRALTKYQLSHLDTTWLDSARVARRTWKEFASSGYGITNVCKKIGYTFKHHDALEDAKASAHVLLAAIDSTELDIQSWLERVRTPIGLANVSSGSGKLRDRNPEGDLYGEVMVFTGALDLPRREAADLAARVGCSVSAGVTKKTSLLVVGDQDVTRLAGKEKSSKHLKAERLIKAGQKIRIIRESDFKELVTHAEENP